MPRREASFSIQLLRITKLDGEVTPFFLALNGPKCDVHMPLRKVRDSLEPTPVGPVNGVLVV